MSKLFREIVALVESGQVKIYEHGYDELSNVNIRLQYLLDTIKDSDVVEEYPNYPKGKCILLLTQDRNRKPVHSLWGVPKGFDSPAVLITAYRPDPKRWDRSYKKRR